MTFPTPAPPPLIEVWGTPEARGQMYGEAARERIASGVAHYSEQLGKSGLSASERAGIIDRILPHIDAYDPGYVPEMRGIAAGSNQPLENIVLLNARTEVLKLAQSDIRMRAAASPDPDPDGCTGLVVMPSATANRRLIHAQNWDWKVECAETAVVLKIASDDGPDILTFTEAGQLARCGMNSAGIAITANYLMCDRDYRSLGVPLAVIRRKVLQQSMLALALGTVYNTPKSASNNIIVSQAGGIAINFECAPDETFQVHPADELIVHANHFQSPVALSKLRDTGVQATPDSLYRDLRVRELLTTHVGEITEDTVKAALFDDYQSPWSVCRPPRENLSSNLSASVAMIVMTPESGVMDVAMLPALNQTFTRYHLAVDDMMARHSNPTSSKLGSTLS